LIALKIAMILRREGRGKYTAGNVGKISSGTVHLSFEVTD